jgi:hypothetical protein
MTAAAPISPDHIAQSLEEWLPDASAAGITSVFDVGTIVLPEEAGYMDLAGAADLSRCECGPSFGRNSVIDLRLMSQRGDRFGCAP